MKLRESSTLKLLQILYSFKTFRFLPEKALKLLHKFYATRVEEETTEARFQRMETTSIPKEKKSE